jgi:hypothetical protein
LQRQTVTAGLIFLLCQCTVFLLQFGESAGSPFERSSVPAASTPESKDAGAGANFFISLIERIGETCLVEALNQDQQLPDPHLQDQSLIMLCKISQRNSWQLHYKLIPFLGRQASRCLSERKFDRALALCELVRSIEDSRSVQLLHAFLLAKNSKLDQAIQLLETVFEEPVPVLDADEISRVSFILKECIAADRSAAAAKIVAILLPVTILNDAQALTERVGGLIYGLISQGDLETAEHLLANAKQQCEGCEYITPELIVPYLCVPIRYASFVKSMWQPKAEQEGTYPQLFELKRQVIARHRARFLSPDT